MKNLTCYQCGHRFEDPLRSPEIQCPRCGSLIEPTRENIQDEVRVVEPADSLRSLQEKTELGDVSSLSERTIIEPIQEEPPVDPTGEAKLNVAASVYQQQTQMVYGESPPVTAGPRPFRWIEVLGPTFIACVLFLGWVAYDKKLKHPVITEEMLNQKKVEEILSRAVRAYRTDQKIQALADTEEALRIAPHSQLAKEIRDLVSP